MIGWIPVSSKQLFHRRLIVNKGAVLERVSLCPFFDPDGRVRTVMVVDANSAEIRFLDPHVDRFHVPWLGPMQIRRKNADTILPTWKDQHISLDGLWHYDPLWLMTESRYQLQDIVPLIRATNCCKKLPPNVRSLYYRRNLRGVVWVYESNEFKYFKRDMLPDPPRLPATPTSSVSSARARRPQWRLNPFWTDA